MVRILLLFLLALACIFIANGDPIDVGGRKQLFIDHRFMAESENITLTMNPAQKLGQITDPDGNRIVGHVSRVDDVDGKFRLYVGADSVSIYESEDGRHFHDTGKAIRGGVFTTVHIDEHDPDPARRLKVFWIQLSNPHNPETDGVYGGYSADGIEITPVGRLLPYYLDNPALLYWDARINKYVIYTRALQANSENQRRIARFEVDDPLKPWPYKKSDTEADTPFLSPHNTDVVMQADEFDDPHSDMYYNAAFIYPWAQDVYVMFPNNFRHFLPNLHPFIQPPKGTWEDFGLLENQIAVSRDGIHWDRLNREPYFPNGLADEWDRWYSVLAAGMVKRGNYLYQYYVSSGRTHDSAFVRQEYANTPPVEDLGGIGVLRQRLDGFVSADADYKGGWITTPAITFTGNRLRLNIDTGAMGTAYVEIRDESGHPLPGFTLADCEEIGGNYIDQMVYWKGNTDVSALAGQPIQVHIKLVRGKIYAFQFTEE